MLSGFISLCIILHLCKASIAAVSYTHLGGTTNATNLTVNTSGNSAAAIRSDRGGGTVVVDKGTYTSNGYNLSLIHI